MLDKEWDRPENLPLPVPDEDSLLFWQGLSDGKFLLQTCIDCGIKNYPPVSMCCQQFNFEWVNAQGTGSIFSYVVTHQPIHPALKGHTPFLTVVVQLDEGPRITSNLVDGDPENIEIGSRVELNLVRLSDEVTLPLFKLCSD